MKYINTKTQAVIETACVVNGGNWQKVDDNQSKSDVSKPVRKTTRKKSGDDDE